MSYPFAPRIKNLQFNHVIDALRQHMRTMEDPRTGKNTIYSMEDIGMAAFSVFFTQSPSFLSHQRLMELDIGKSNATSFFGIEAIPTDNHIRTQLDTVNASHFFPLFKQIFDWLNDHNKLDPYLTLNDQLLIAMDGTHYHSSTQIHCDQCSHKTGKDGVTHYFHSVVTPVIVGPNCSQVLPLEPVFIQPQDGHNKQDCENAAAKRWMREFGIGYAKDHLVTLLGDDLYSRQPVCQQALDSNLNFLYVCKPGSHKALYEWVDEMEQLQKINTLKITRKEGKKTFIDHYRWLNQVPLNGKETSMEVNWCELESIDTTTNKKAYHNAFITNHLIHKDNITQMVAAGRTRWKVENENNNTLKTKGYHLSHNFGHGKQHLSALLATFNLLAFLFHTLLEQMDSKFQLVRNRLPTRTICFQHISMLTSYHLFKSFNSLMRFMLERLESGPQPPPPSKIPI